MKEKYTTGFFDQDTFDTFGRNMNQHMISVQQAISLIEQNMAHMPKTTILLSEISGHILYEDILAPIDHPPFDASAMDGYAVSKEGLNERNNTYHVIGESKAGDSLGHLNVQKGECIRIYTGAPVPSGTYSVIMQEKVVRYNDMIEVEEEIVGNKNIRKAGEQLKKGSLLLEKGTHLNPASIGLLASFGVKEVPVYAKPSVSVIATGSELVSPGEPLPEGKIYESNSFMIVSALQSNGFDRVDVVKTHDDFNVIKDQIEHSFEKTDVVLLSGGISVGDYDFVGKALEEIGVETLFYKIKQKPGKPLFFGRYKGKYVFALPGNPASALCCFYIYVLPALRQMAGYERIHLPIQTANLTNDQVRSNLNRDQFLKASVEGNLLTVLEGQSSAMLHTFSAANALAYIPSGDAVYKTGDPIQSYLLPS